MKRLLCIVFLLKVFTRLSRAVTVTQDKAFVLLHAGSAMEDLSCVHDASSSYNMYWYRQKAGGGPELIAFSVAENNAEIEKGFEKKWTLSRTTNEKAVLKHNGAVEIQDSAVYYCAASIHSHWKLRHSRHKTYREKVKAD